MIIVTMMNQLASNLEFTNPVISTNEKKTMLLNNLLSRALSPYFFLSSSFSVPVTILVVSLDFGGIN